MDIYIPLVGDSYNTYSSSKLGIQISDLDEIDIIDNRTLSVKKSDLIKVLKLIQD